jgi:hypothetical protein
MYNWLYKWWNYTEDDIRIAENQVGFLEDRICEINGNIKLTGAEKKIKIDKMKLSIMSIKYTFCL